MSDMGCCVRSVSKKMSDVLPVGGGSGGPSLEELGFLGMGGGGLGEIAPKSNLPPPLTKKTKLTGKKGGLDTTQKPLIIGESPWKIINIVVTKRKIRH